jgi:hypothetical protein
MVKVIPKKNHYTTQAQDSIQNIINAANEGCLLHQFYVNELISEAQFHSGLAFAKLYSLAMRSFGIHNRIKTASQSWDQLHGIVHDQFSNKKIEGLWRYIIKALDPIYHQGTPMRDITFNLVLTMEYPKQYAINDIRKTLSYLQTIWEKIETSPYQLGLFAYEQPSTHATLH